MAAAFRDQPCQSWYTDQQDRRRARILEWNTQRVNRQRPTFGSDTTAASSWSCTAPGSPPTPGCSCFGNVRPVFRAPPVASEPGVTAFDNPAPAAILY